MRSVGREKGRGAHAGARVAARPASVTRPARPHSMTPGGTVQASPYAIVYAGRVADRTSVAGDLLRLARVKAQLTQDQLAQRAGVAQSLVSAYENGRRQPTMPTLMRLLEAAGFDLRMRLEEPDDQALAAEQWAEARPAAERRRWKREQEAVASSR